MARHLLVVARVVAGAVAGGLVLAAVAEASVPPPDGAAGVDLVRQQAEAAAVEHFATVVDGGATNIACEVPPEDAAGATFLCYGLAGDGTVLVAVATINDYGSAELTELPAGSAGSPTTSSSAALPTSVSGSGTEVVQVDPVTGPAIVTVTHEGAGTFAVQPQQGGVPTGDVVVTATGPVAGRYLLATADTFSAFAVTADGAWTLSVEPTGAALPFDATAGAEGSGPDVVAYDDVSAVTVDYGGPGPIVVRAATVSGRADLVGEAGAFTGDVELPPGPGFLTIEAPGDWALRPVDPPSTTTP